MTIKSIAAWIVSVAAACVIIYNVTDYLGIRVFTSGEAAQAHETLSKEINGLMVVAQSNAEALALQRWQYLNEKKKNRDLEVNEQREYCILSKQLNFIGIGCA